MTAFLVVFSNSPSEAYLSTISRIENGRTKWKLIRTTMTGSQSVLWAGVTSTETTSYIVNESNVVVATGYAKQGDHQNVTSDNEGAALASSLAVSFTMPPESAFHAMYGEFSGVVVDVREKRLILVRDHIGARPLYYARSEGVTIASTDMAAVAAAAGALRADVETMKVMVQAPNGFTYPPGRTIIEGIRRVRPGFYVEIANDSESTRQYWDPRKLQEFDGIDFHKAVDESRKILQDAVSSRVRNIQTIGSHISGGLDSSTVSAVLAEHVRGTGRRAVYFSWSPDSPEAPATGELARIRALQKRYKFEVAFLDAAPLRASGFSDPHNDLLRPSDNIILEQYVAAEAGRRGVGLMLSGLGGDEALSHAHHGVAYALFRRGKLGKLLRHLGPRNNETLVVAAKRLLHRLRWELLDPIMAGENFRRISTHCFARPNGRLASPLIWGPEEMMDTAAELRETQIRFLTAGYLAERMESWHTHAAERGFEYGFPLLDRKLLEYVLRLPPWFFCRHGQTRALARSVASMYWPDNLVASDLKLDPVLWDFLEGATVVKQPRVVPGSFATAWIDLEKVSNALKAPDASAYWASKAQMAIEVLTRFPPKDDQLSAQRGP